MQMRHLVAEACEIDFLRRQHRALRFFNRANGGDDPRQCRRVQIGQLAHVRIKNHAAETGVVRIIDAHDAQQRRAQNEFAAVLAAQRAVSDSGRVGIRE